MNLWYNQITIKEVENNDDVINDFVYIRIIYHFCINYRSFQDLFLSQPIRFTDDVPVQTKKKNQKILLLKK